MDSASAIDSIAKSRCRRSLAPCSPLAYQPRCFRNSSTVFPCRPEGESRGGRAAARQRTVPPHEGAEGGGSTREECAAVAEDPGIAERPAGDHDAGAPRLIPHAHDVLCRHDVPIPDHGDLERLDDASDLVPARLPREHLGAGAGVERESTCARVLHAKRDADRVASIVAPSAAGLDRHREVRCPDHRSDDALHQIEISAGIPSRRFAGRPSSPGSRS